MPWRIHRFPSVDSTMTVAASLPVGSVVVADEQTAGIGRQAHSWESKPDAGLYTSIVLDQHPVLTLALGLTAQAAIRKVTSLACDIRWPNDLMFGEKKFGGILVQLQGDRAVAGIGINVGQRHFSPELKQIATSLAMETNLEFRRDDVLDALLESLPAFLSLSKQETILRWQRASTWGLGKRVRVELGEKQIHGVTVGLDADGFLRVQRDDGAVETILAGSVRPL